jgi:hypothetical protein
MIGQLTRTPLCELGPSEPSVLGTFHGPLTERGPSSQLYVCRFTTSETVETSKEPRVCKTELGFQNLALLASVALGWLVMAAKHRDIFSAS